ncbi:MAG: FAD-binding oxidoreductase [Anaerolineae bacterium]
MGSISGGGILGVVTEQDILALQSVVGQENVSVRGADLEAHSIDESWFEPCLPDVVVWPTSEQQIVGVVRYAYEHAIPLVAWSGGSSLEGNPVPVCGGIILALYRMNKVLEIREDDLQVVVEPGIIYDALNAQLGRKGLFFPPAPGSADVATIGGMVANNSSGMRAVKYGVTRDYVLKLKVVLPDGRLITVGTNAKKSSSGYDLVGLFVGSEGTLGIVTEITLQVMGLPEKVASVVAAFEDLSSATTTVYEAVRYGLDPSAIELMDPLTVAATNRQQNLELRETPTLFVEFHGTESGVLEQVAYLRELCEDNGCVEVSDATTPEAREKLWLARSEARESIKSSHPGCAMISGDICVPISRFVEMVEFVSDLREKLGLPIYCFGHAGDGNLHTEIIVRKEMAEEFALGNRGTDEIVRHALELGGTATGEHGVGLGKRDFMVQEHGEALNVMRAIKAVLDPKGIMNPGKIFPDQQG